MLTKVKHDLSFKIIIIIIFNFFIDSGKLLDRLGKRILTLYMDTKGVSFFIPATFLFHSASETFFF
jgi:hypothetical protein